MMPIKSQLMDRSSDALVKHVCNCQQMDIRQTRRGWFQELLFGCEARTEFKYYVKHGRNGRRTQIAHSLETSNCCFRLCCCPVLHPFTMHVKEVGTQANLLTLDRPLRCAPGPCKCCCHQAGYVTSNYQPLGHVRETCYVCVPEFDIYDHTGAGLYRVHPPTCCCGTCYNVCAEGIPCCGRGCCKVPFHIFPYDQYMTDNARHIGKILKKPKSWMVEVFTDASAFEVDFPQDATPDQKGVIIATAILLNAVFFEEKHQNQDASAVVE